MISIIKLYNSSLDIIRGGTTGQIDTQRFVNVANEVQISLQRLFVDVFEENQAVKDALINHIVTKLTTTNNLGVLPLEANYVRFLSVIKANDKPAYPINVNEVSTMNDSYIRSPNIAKGRIYFYQNNGYISFLPATIINILYNYLKKPTPCALIGTPISTANSDYLTFSGAVDLDWPEELFDMFLYSILKKLGFELKDELTTQFAQMNISQEQLNTNPI